MDTKVFSKEEVRTLRANLSESKTEVKQGLASIASVCRELKRLFDDGNSSTHKLLSAIGVTGAEDISPVALFGPFYVDGAIHRPATARDLKKMPPESLAACPVFDNFGTGTHVRLIKVCEANVNSSVTAYLNAIFYIVREGYTKFVLLDRERRKIEKEERMKAKKAAKKATKNAKSDAKPTKKRNKTS